MKRSALFLMVALSAWTAVSHAEEKVELVDEDKDGRQETSIFSNEYGKIRAEVDRNGDGKPDRFVKFKGGVRFSAENDKDHDGKIDSWDYYSPKGSLLKTGLDRNGDGKPDQFKQMLKGRTLVLKETDRNFDGKIDRRQLDQWGTRKFGPGIPEVPGYITLWKEEDNDHDGKIDVYHERGNKSPSKARIGKPIETPPSGYGPQPKSPPRTEKPEDRRLREQNERYGLT
jgi:hypothetical protein